MARVVVGVDGCAGEWLAVMQQMGRIARLLSNIWQSAQVVER